MPMRRELIAGMLVALVAGYAITKAVALLDLGSGAIAAGLAVVVVALSSLHMHRAGRHPGTGQDLVR